MLRLRVILGLLAVPFVAVRGQAITSDDIPTNCQSQCQSVLQIAQNCQSNNGGTITNSNQQNCICQQQNANSFSTCNSCVNQYSSNNDNDSNNINNNDGEVNDWMQTCNFPSTSVSGNIYPSSTINGAATGSCSTILVTATVSALNNVNNNENSYSTTLSRSIYCGGLNGLNGSDGALATSFRTATYTSTGVSSTYTSTAVFGSGTGGTFTSSPTNSGATTTGTNSPGSTTTSAATFTGAAVAYTALPYAGAALGFLGVAFVV